MKKPTVSIIVPFYRNTPDSFEVCIESLISQTYCCTEIILVSDGASVNLNTIARTYSEKYKNVIWIKKENGGVSSARNYGIKRASGEYVLFVDSDDYIDDDYVYKIMERIQKKHDRTILIGGMLKYIDNGNMHSEFSKEMSFTKEKMISGIIDDKIHGTACRFIYDAERIRQNELIFDENVTYMEDAIFVASYCIKSNIEEIELLPVFYNYVKSNNSATSRMKCEDALSSIYKALDSINLLTGHRYEANINNSKIRFMEGKLTACSKLNRGRVVDRFKRKISPKYRGGRVRYKLFMFALTRKNAVKALDMYYVLMDIVRRIVGKK